MRDYWEKTKIGDYCEVGDGAHASLDRQEDGIVYLTSKNFKDGGLDLSKVDYISEKTYKQYFRSDSRALTQPQENDVIFSIIGTIGEPYVVKRGEKFGLSSAVSILRPDNEKVLTKYLYYWIRGHHFQDAIYSIKGGVAQSYISQEMIRSLPLYVPPISEQSRIASILSAFDNHIENNTRRIEILEEMARRIYREWFVHFHYPGHENDELVDSGTELGEIPEGWEVKKLEDFGEIVLGKTPSTKDSENYGNHMPFIKTPDMHDQFFIHETENVLSIKGVKTQKKKTLPADSICVSCIGTAGVVAIISVPSQTNQQINSIVPEDTALREYLYFTTKALKPLMEKIGSTGATMTNVSKTKFKGLPALKPSEELLNEFHKKVGVLFDQISTLQKQNMKLKETRYLLLPKLISGEVEYV